MARKNRKMYLMIHTSPFHCHLHEPVALYPEPDDSGYEHTAAVIKDSAGDGDYDDLTSWY